MKKLYRSEEDKVLAGIFGGIGEYLDVDSTILRLAYVLIAVVTSIVPAVIGYVIAMLIMPKRPTVVHMNHSDKTEEKNDEKKEEPVETPKNN
jgi:phage shock protein C